MLRPSAARVVAPRRLFDVLPRTRVALIALSRSGATLRGKLAMFLPRLPVIRVAAALVAAAAGVGGLAIGGELRIEHRLDRVNAEGRRRRRQRRRRAMIGARTNGRIGDDPDGPALEDAPAPQERVVVVPLRTMLAAIGLVLGAVLAVELVGRARAGLTLIAVAAFLALALNPSVVALQRRGLRRGEAVAAVCALAAVGVTCIALVLVPPLVEQGGRFVDALPRIVAQLTDGHGPLGFLETRYHVVERLREATSSSGGLAREATSAVSVLRSVAATVLGVVVIAFLTLFMLIEAPEWRRRAIALTPQRQRPAVERVGAGLYRSVAGFVTGTLLASLAAAVVTTAVMLVAGIPYALPLAVFVAIVEVVPFIGPVLATLVVTAVAITESPATAAVVFGLLLAYHAIEGHTLRPFLYGRAVRLSPLTVLISILLCTEIAGILGAVVAIPVAGTVDVLARELLGRQTSSEGAHA